MRRGQQLIKSLYLPLISTRAFVCVRTDMDVFEQGNRAFTFFVIILLLAMVS